MNPNGVTCSQSANHIARAIIGITINKQDFAKGNTAHYNLRDKECHISTSLRVGTMIDTDMVAVDLSDSI
jgi:hypothetical protein